MNSWFSVVVVAQTPLQLEGFFVLISETSSTVACYNWNGVGEGAVADSICVEGEVSGWEHNQELKIENGPGWGDPL